MSTSNDSDYDSADFSDDSGDEPASINTYFPNEILAEILNRLASFPRDVCSAKLVCRRWQQIVDEMVGHKITATSFYSILPHLSTEGEEIKLDIPDNLKDIQELNKYTNIAIRDLTLGCAGMLIFESLTPKIKQIQEEQLAFLNLPFPHVLHKLSCFEPISPNIFSTLKPLSSLAHLHLSLFSLASINTKSFLEMGVFRALQTLIISNVPSYPSFNNFSAVPQLNMFLEHIHAPCIKRFEVDYPICSLTDIEKDNTEHVMNFVRRMSQSLRQLSVAVNSPDQNFTSPTKDFEYPVKLLEDMEKLGEHVNNSNLLISVELKDNHLHSLRPSTQIKAWATMIKQQQNLKSLRLYLKSSIHLGKDLIPILSRNAATLKTLNVSSFPCQIDQDLDVVFVPIDCRFLRELTVLENLRISDRLINTRYLPPSLNNIYIDAMLANEDARDVVLWKHGAVERIQLKDTRGGAPKGIGYGVTVDTLKAFIQGYTNQSWKNMVQRLIIHSGCTDGKFPEQGFWNGDLVKPLHLRKRKPALLLKDSDSNSSVIEYESYERAVRIDWVLNERGFYQDHFGDEYEKLGMNDTQSDNYENNIVVLPLS